MKRMLAWAGAALVLGGAAGCGGGDNGGSGGKGASGASSGGANGAPTYYEDIAPIVNEHCLSCHTDGGIAPFSLTTYENAKTAAGSIKIQTAARTMPPFHIDNSGACNTYREARWLSDDQIATIAAWVDGGALEGDPKHAPPLPGAPPGLAHVDATLDTGVTYTPDASLSDDYRCFLVDPGLVSDAYLTGYDVKPGEPRVVHHAVLYAPNDAAAEAQAESLDQAAGGPGYQCFGGVGVPAVPVMAWAPGMPATSYPEGTGLHLSAGRKLVLQVHYNLTFGALPDRTKIDISLAPSVAKPASMYATLDWNLKLAPGQASAVDESTSMNNSPVPLTVYGIFPHMHTLGRTLSLEADLSGKTTCIGDVPDWNFHWQQFYMYSSPITLEPGATLRLKCTYDTRAEVDTVAWGEGTKDEMCVAMLYVTK